jgi:hypothetical protein
VLSEASKIGGFMKKIFFGLGLVLISSQLHADLRDIRPIPPILMPPREVPCADALRPYINWASGATPGEEDVRWVNYMSVYNQNKNSVQPGIDKNQNLVGYTAGALRHQGGALVGDAKSFFSDRTFCANPSEGAFCTNTAPFNPNATDLAGITLSPDGKVTTVLKSWGNATYTDQMVCLDNGIFYIPSKSGQKYMSVVTLQKTGYRRPR